MASAVRQGILKIVSEFSPVGIIESIGLVSPLSKSTILLEIFLGNSPDNFEDVYLRLGDEFNIRFPAQEPTTDQITFILTILTLSSMNNKARVSTQRLRQEMVIAWKKIATSGPVCTRNTGARLMDDTALPATSVGLDASGGLLSTIITMPFATDIQAGAIVCGLLGTSGKL